MGERIVDWYCMNGVPDGLKGAIIQGRPLLFWKAWYPLLLFKTGFYSRPCHYSRIYHMFMRYDFMEGGHWWGCKIDQALPETSHESYPPLPKHIQTTGPPHYCLWVVLKPTLTWKKSQEHTTKQKHNSSLKHMSTPYSLAKWMNEVTFTLLSCTIINNSTAASITLNTFISTVFYFNVVSLRNFICTFIVLFSGSVCILSCMMYLNGSFYFSYFFCNGILFSQHTLIYA